MFELWSNAVFVGATLYLNKAARLLPATNCFMNRDTPLLKLGKRFEEIYVLPVCGDNCYLEPVRSTVNSKIYLRLHREDNKTIDDLNGMYGDCYYFTPFIVTEDILFCLVHANIDVRNMVRIPLRILMFWIKHGNDLISSRSAGVIFYSGYYNYFPALTTNEEDTLKKKQKLVQDQIEQRKGLSPFEKEPSLSLAQWARMSMW